MKKARVDLGRVTTPRLFGVVPGSRPLISNDTELLVACAERDLGLAFVVESEARRELAAGALETALDDYATSVDGSFLYFPTSARGAPKLRALVECARQSLNGQKATSTPIRSRKRSVP